MTGDEKTTEQDSIPMDGFELICDIQTHNLTQSALWVADNDLSKVRSEIKSMESLEKALDKLDKHNAIQDDMGVMHIHVFDAAQALHKYILPRSNKLKEREEYLTGHKEKLRQDLDDLAKERKKRAKQKKKKVTK